MRIVRVDDERYFLVDSPRDYENMALKLLNERRTMQQDAGDLKDFIEHITDEQDGDLAINMVQRLYDVAVFTPEII